MEPIGQSDLVEIAKRNGDFKRNYGPLLGAFLYLRSLSAVRGKSLFWSGALAAGFYATLHWLVKQGWLTKGLP
jgi:hypothetical protein